MTDGLNLTYGSAGTYNGLDRFGRVVDQLWQDDSFDPVDRYKYAYDPAGNRTKRENVLADDANKDLSEAYSYDEVYRLIATDRGQFDGGDFTKSSDYQQWTLDGIGNFAEFKEDTDGQAGFELEQTRDTNTANEIQTISGSAAWVAPTYDAAGNMISMPKPGTETTRLFAVYDAWNRLKKVYAGDSDTAFEPSDGPGGGADALLATYEHDGLNRRIEKEVRDATGTTVVATTDYFFNENWQLLESRTQTGSGPTATAVDQYLFDISYIDARVCRFHDADGDGLREDGDTVRYYTWDANFNVTAAFDGTYNAGSGQYVFGTTPTERYVYATYGEALVYNAAWSNTPAAPTADGPLFASYWLDAETGMMDVRYRPYHTTLSTFIVTDPVEADPNTYRYCENQSTGRVDPSGLTPPGSLGGVYQLDVAPPLTCPLPASPAPRSPSTSRPPAAPNPNAQPIDIMTLPRADVPPPQVGPLAPVEKATPEGHRPPAPVQKPIDIMTLPRITETCEKEVAITPKPWNGNVPLVTFGSFIGQQKFQIGLTYSVQPKGKNTYQICDVCSSDGKLKIKRIKYDYNWHVVAGVAIAGQATWPWNGILGLGILFRATVTVEAGVKVEGDIAAKGNLDFTAPDFERWFKLPSARLDIHGKAVTATLSGKATAGAELFETWKAYVTVGGKIEYPAHFDAYVMMDNTGLASGFHAAWDGKGRGRLYFEGRASELLNPDNVRPIFQYFF